MSTTQTTEVRRINGRMFFFGVVGVVFLTCSGFLIVTYAVPGEWANAVRNVLPLPLVVVERNQIISFREVAGNLRSIRRFYETQDFSEVGMRVDFSSDDGKKRLKIREKELVNKMIEDRAIESLARSRDIIVSDEMVDQSVNRKLDEFGSTGSVEEDLNRLYGWTLRDFKNKIVRSALYEEALSGVFEKDGDGIGKVKLKIGEVETALARGSPFDQVVRDLSDGRTAEDGGRLGWFVLDDLIPELRKSVETARVGVVGSTVESPLGFHVLRVDDAKEENGIKRYQLSQIFVKKPLFSDWLSEQMQHMNIWVFDTEYDWNRETARLEFRDESLKNFETELMQNKTGDPAFLFY
ncbi:MAG: peptidylprolyl isomerase [Candidatus Moraniibacteriota bacterium]